MSEDFVGYGDDRDGPGVVHEILQTLQEVEGLPQDHGLWLLVEWVLVRLQLLELFVLVSLERVPHHDQFVLELFAGPYVNLAALEVLHFDLHVGLLVAEFVVVDGGLGGVDALLVELADDYARELDVFVHELGDGVRLLDVFGDVLDLVPHLFDLLVVFELALELLLLFLDGSLVAVLLLLHLFHRHVPFDLQLLHLVRSERGLLLLQLLDLLDLFLTLLFLLGLVALGLHAERLLLLLELLFPLLRLDFRLLQLLLLLFLLPLELLLLQSQLQLHFLLVLLSFLLLDLKLELPLLLFHFVDFVEGLVPVDCVMILSAFFICVILANDLALISSNTLFEKS